MASSCNRFLSRSSLAALKSAVRSSSPKSAAARSPSISGSRSPLLSPPLPRRFLSRIPSELGCVQSMLPLHSAVAAARMTCCLSTSSRSCRALSQELGLSVPR